MDYYSGSTLKLALSKSDLPGPPPDQLMPSGASPYGGTNNTKYTTLSTGSASVKGTTLFSVNVGYSEQSRT